MKLDPFVRQYLDTLLWSSVDDVTGKTMDELVSVDDLPSEIIQQAIADCASFCVKIGDELYGSFPDEDLAHNFALTRNHHGAGFWDGDFGDGWDCLVLCAVSYSFGEIYIAFGDDRQIYAY